MTQPEKDGKAPVFPYQRIVPNPSTEDLGKPSGAPTNPNMYTSKVGEPKDDLVTIFRRMLDLGTPEYEHELAGFLHNGPPKMRYVYIKEEDRWEDNGDPIIKEWEAKYFEERRKEKERRTRIADKIKTLTVTKKEDLQVLSDEKFDFQCYTLGCKFVTNTKADYERHVVTKHYGKGLCYPGKVDIKMRSWTAQGRKWEI